MSLSIHQIAVGGYDDNFAYLIEENDTKQTFIIDPSGNFDEIAKVISSKLLVPVGILITHTHQDHIDQLTTALAKFPVPVYAHEKAAPTLEMSTKTKPLEDGDAIMLGNHTIDVIYTPGHSDDHVCFYIKAEHASGGSPKLIAGDTLFVEGCGRTTPTRVKDLFESLQELKALPDNTEVFPGHNYGSQPHSTIAHEKNNNKYLLASDFNTFKALRLR